VIAEMNKEAPNRPDIAEATLQGPHGTLAFRLFKTEVCFQIANDIFAGTTYPNIPFVSGVKTILDIGANVGAASVYLAMSYPESRVYAFEQKSPVSARRKPLNDVTKYGISAQGWPTQS